MHIFLIKIIRFTLYSNFVHTSTFKLTVYNKKIPFLNQVFGLLPGGQVDACASDAVPALHTRLVAAAAQDGVSSGLPTMLESTCGRALSLELCTDRQLVPVPVDEFLFHETIGTSTGWVFSIPSSPVEVAQQGLNCTSHSLNSFVGLLEYEMELRSHFALCQKCEHLFFQKDNTQWQCSQCTKWANYTDSQRWQLYHKHHK